MKVIDIKKELKKRGVSTIGLKEVFVARLKDAILKNVPLVENLAPKEADNLAGDVFSPGAYWKELPCEGEYVKEDIPNGFRAPTVPLGENASVQKRNYGQTFDRMAFTGQLNYQRE